MLCTDVADWSITTAGSEDKVKIGYDYGRFVTGDEQHVDIDEEAVSTDNDQAVPDPLEERTIMATSAEVFTCVCITCSNAVVCFYNFVISGTRELGLDPVDLADESPPMFESLSQEHGE